MYNVAGAMHCIANKKEEGKERFNCCVNRCANDHECVADNFHMKQGMLG